VVAARSQARAAWVQARTARISDTIALYQALAGGGSAAPNPP
jgi:outer membrane protein TolC